MKPQKRIILAASVLLFTISCNLFMGNEPSQVEEPHPSKEEVKEEKEIKQEEAEENIEEKISPTETPPPTDTPIPPTDIPEPEAISAADPEITIGEFTFRVIAVGYDSTALGMAPSSMGAGDQIVWVECELLSGDQAAFGDLHRITDNFPARGRAVAVLPFAQVGAVEQHDCIRWDLAGKCADNSRGLVLAETGAERNESNSGKQGQQHGLSVHPVLRGL